MNRNKKLVSVLLAALLLVHPATSMAFPVLDQVKMFGTAWHKYLTGKMISRTDGDIIKRSVILPCIATPIYIMFSAVYQVAKMQIALAIAIDNNANDTVRQIAPRLMKHKLGGYLWNALKHNNLDALQILLENGARADSPSILGDTPLCDAMQHDNFEAAHLLLDHGANPVSANIRGVCPLSYAYKNKELTLKMWNNLKQAGTVSASLWAETITALQEQEQS